MHQRGQFNHHHTLFSKIADININTHLHIISFAKLGDSQRGDIPSDSIISRHDSIKRFIMYIFIKHLYNIVHVYIFALHIFALLFHLPYTRLKLVLSVYNTTQNKVYLILYMVISSINT